jgi:hypothetical protein
MAALLAAGSAAAQHSNTPFLVAAVKSAIDRGELLYVYDRAAWVGTDDFLGRFSNLTTNAGGYVVTGDEAVTELVFYDKSKARALYRATFNYGKMTKGGLPAADRTALTPLEIQMIVAKDKAANAFTSAKVGLCSDANPNLAALPPQRPNGPTIVYIMTPQTDATYPLGGHYSVEVQSDGSVGKVRRFMNSCIAMGTNDVPKGGKPVGFVITHLLDPTPTEIHVFTSLASKMPIFVSTSGSRLWEVDGNRITTVNAKH